MRSAEILKKVKEDYKTIGQEFSQTRSHAWPEFNVAEKIIRKKIKEKGSARIADIGCGNGRLGFFLKDEPIEYYGLDSSKILLRYARKNIPKNAKIRSRFIEANMETRRLPAKHFDLVCSFAALHHLPTQRLQEKALRNFHRLVAPGGVCIVTAWNLWRKIHRDRINKTNHHALIPWRASHTILRFYYAFRAEELKNLLQKSGFTKIRRMKECHPHNISFLCRVSNEKN